MSLKVVFIQPYYQNIWDSIGVGYIVSYCKKHAPEVEYDFFQGNFDDDATIVAGCADADIVGFSCTTPVFQPAIRLSRAIKEVNPRVHCVFGSWHVSAVISEALVDGVDQIVVGEGEDAFLKIIRGNRNPVIYGTRLGFQDLPWPDRRVIKNYRTVDLCESMNGLRIASFQANRVCPVNCVFCSERTVTGKFNKITNPIRSRDPVDICREIRQVIDDLDLTYFKFVDATFDISPEYVISFCQEKIRRGIDTPWEALVHPALANEEMMKWLQKSNCNQINMGVESGSDKVLKTVGKGTRIKHIKNAFAWAKRYGIERRAFFILGMPNETITDLAQTENLINDIQPDVVGFTILCPYPGTPLYRPEKHRDVNWETADEYSNDFWETEHFSNDELHKWQSYFTAKYTDTLCERQE